MNALASPTDIFRLLPRSLPMGFFPDRVINRAVSKWRLKLISLFSLSITSHLRTGRSATEILLIEADSLPDIHPATFFTSLTWQREGKKHRTGCCFLASSVADATNDEIGFHVD